MKTPLVNNSIYYLIIDKHNHNIKKYVFSDCVVNFMIGRNYKDYIILKSKYDKISVYDNYKTLDELDQQLESDTFNKGYSYLP